MSRTTKPAFTLATVADALVMAERTRDATNERRDYYAARATALLKAFKVSDLRQGPGSRRFGPLLQHTIELAARSYGLSPFAGLMEAPAAVAKLYERFAGLVELGELEYRRALLELLTAMLEALTDVRAVTDAALARTGFDFSAPAPPEPSIWDDV